MSCANKNSAAFKTVTDPTVKEENELLTENSQQPVLISIPPQLANQNTLKNSNARTVMRIMPLSELKNNGLAASDNLLNKENGQPSNVITNTKSNKGRRSENNTPRVRTPQAVAVARRNARERNRVKQVNNGFAALRQHIPPEIAEIFEQAAAKGSSKKLSKVETLRMAVEYIRQLESMLGHQESPVPQTNTISLPATPPPETIKQPQPNCFFAIKPRRVFDPNSPDSTDLMSNSDTQIAIINGQQYIKIPGTQTFKLLVHESFDEDEEIMKPDISQVSSNATTAAMTTMSDDSIPSFMDDSQPAIEIVNGINIANRYDTITTIPGDCVVQNQVTNDFSLMAPTATVMTVVKEEIPDVSYQEAKFEQTIFYDPKTKTYSLASFDPISNQCRIEPLTAEMIAAAGLELNMVPISDESQEVLTVFRPDEQFEVGY